MIPRIVSYIKDEIMFIEHWLNYHSKIIPLYHVHIFDNGSTDGTLDILYKYKNNHGLNVYQHDDYTKKGEVVTEFILKYNKQSSIIFPIDGDEFICMYRDSNVITNANDIKKYIHGMKTIPGKYRILGSLNSIPEKPHYVNPLNEIDKFKWTWTEKDLCKKIYCSDSFQSTDLGFHRGICNSKDIIETKLAYLHFHDVGHEHYREKCLKDMSGLGYDINNKQLLDSLRPTTPGFHKLTAIKNIKNWSYKSTDTYDIKLETPLCT